jgi:pilus assembly protein CpaE
MRPRAGPAGERGQATIELVALLPCVAAVIAALWQAALLGWAAWGAHAAARAAARAHAVDGDPAAAARRHLPADLEPGLRVTPGSSGAVRVVVRIPSPPAFPSLGHIGAEGHFEPQS